MRWLLANPLRTLPPLGLVAVGAVAGVIGVPVVKKTARNLAVMTVRGVLTVTDAVKGAGGSLGQSWQGMVEEARGQQTQMDLSRQTHGNTKEAIFSMDDKTEQ